MVDLERLAPVCLLQQRVLKSLVAVVGLVAEKGQTRPAQPKRSHESPREMRRPRRKAGQESYSFNEKKKHKKSSFVGNAACAMRCRAARIASGRRQQQRGWKRQLLSPLFTLAHDSRVSAGKEHGKELQQTREAAHDSSSCSLRPTHPPAQLTVSSAGPLFSLFVAPWQRKKPVSLYRRFRKVSRRLLLHNRPVNMFPFVPCFAHKRELLYVGNVRTNGQPLLARKQAQQQR